MRNWLQQTHGPRFELLRHFLRRFFESEANITPGQLGPVLIGLAPVVFQWFFLLVTPMRRKYAYLSGLPTPSPYLEAVRADELWLITLAMSAIGLLTALRWQFLFPDLRDYRVLGALPLHPRQIFAAKLAAFVLIAAAAGAAAGFLPTFGFPLLASGRWAPASSLGGRVLAQAAASAAAGAFFFFALVALQGVLLNLLPPRAFGRVSATAQGALSALMLALLVLSFSIQPQAAAAVLRPQWARWLPPVWFLGLHQTLCGDSGAAMRALAHRAEAGLAVSVALALLTYHVSYRRHRTLLAEGAAARVRKWRDRSRPAWFEGDPRPQGALAFLSKSLARSGPHRLILMTYGGLGFAVVFTGLLDMRHLADPARLVLAGFVYYHLLALLLLVICARQLFSRPVELQANWIFQITEAEARPAWLSALDRFVLFWGAALMLVFPGPLEVRLLGWRALPEAALLAAGGLLAYEWFFSSWRKLPLACSSLPVRTPVWMILALFGLLGVLAAVHTLLLAILSSPVAYFCVFAAIVVLWKRVHDARRRRWLEFRLVFDDLPEPAVQPLNLRA